MRVLVTAGPTHEPLDPVRYIGNRSSGKMGYAIARAAAARGHTTVLVSGPVALRAPRNTRRICVETAADMLAAVRRELRGCDALIMAAAVADWRPAAVSRCKMKKDRGAPVITLVPTPDILATVRPLKGNRVFVGFAAETGALEREAARKLRDKNLDLIVGNDVARPGSGFAVDTNQVLLLFADGRREEWPLMSKRAVAQKLVRVVESLLAAHTRGRPAAVRRGPHPMINRPTKSKC